MSVHAEGTIIAQVANRDHQEPPQTLELGAIASGATATVRVGKYVNTGNLAQTLTVNLINLINCTSHSLVFTNDNNQETGNTVTLEPHTGANLTASVVLETEAVGAADKPFSFDVESVWV